MGSPPPGAGPDVERLGRAVVALATVMSAALAVVAVVYRTTLFADGSFFVLSILTPDPWTFGWQSYPNRITAYALTILPPFWVGRLTGDAAAAVATYSAIMGALPLLGLAATRCLATPGSPWPVLCAISTILLAFHVTFFPTEMWLAHALIWPLVALVLRPRASLAIVATLGLATAFVHEAAVPLVALALINGWIATRRPAWLVLAVGIVGAALAVKWLAPIANGEIARTVGMNALDFLSPGNFFTNVGISTLMALALWAIMRMILRPASVRGEILIVAVICLLAAIQLTFWPGPPHVLRRYVARSLIFGGLALTLSGMIALQIAPPLAGSVKAFAHRHGRALAAAAALAVLVSAFGHAADTVRFLAEWHRLEETLAGPVPTPDDMPSGMVAITHHGDRVAGRAPWALPTGGPIDMPNRAPDDAGPFTPRKGFPPGPGWTVGWHWALPLHSTVPTRTGAPGFIVVVPAATFSPISCATMRSLDRARTLMPRERLELVTRYICELEDKRLAPPPRPGSAEGAGRS